MVMLASAEFWVAVSFVLFFALLAKVGVPGLITKALDDRADAIRKELDEAKKLREEAQRLLGDYKRKQREADDEAKAIIEQARKEAESLAAATQKSLAESVARRTKLAEEKIARAEAQAIGEVRAAAVDLAIGAAERIIAGKTTGAAGASLVDQGIRDLKGRLS